MKKHGKALRITCLLVAIGVAVTLDSCSGVEQSHHVDPRNDPGNSGCVGKGVVGPGKTATVKLFDGSEYVVKGGSCFDFAVLSAQKSAYAIHELLYKRFCAEVGAEKFAPILGHGIVVDGDATDLANDSRSSSQNAECVFSNNLAKPTNSVAVRYEQTGDPNRVYPYLLQELRGYGAVVKEVQGTAARTATFGQLTGSYRYKQGYIVDNEKGVTVTVSVTSESLMGAAAEVAGKALSVAEQFD